VTPDVTLPATDPSALPSPFAAAGLNKWHIAGAIVAILGPAAITFALLRGLGPGGDTLPAADQASMLATKRTTGDPSPAAIVSKWTDANSARWVSNRRQSIAFELPAENTASAGLGRVRPVLVVRCLANTTDVFVYTQWPAAMERQDDGRTTHVSFDGEAESTERWLTSADHDALFAPHGIAFARRVASGQTLRFGFTPHNGARETLEFHLSGFGAHVGSISRLCRWK
jgi:hypothetical protein